MIDLYALTSPNVQKVFLALEELELPYNTIPIDVWKSEQYSPEFAKINPNRKVPAIVDHEGPGGKPYTVIESGAILIYLAEKTGKLLPKDGAARYDVLQWLMLQMSTMGPMFGQLVHFTRFAPKGNDYSFSRYRTEVQRIYDLFEERLAAHANVVGAEYTIADIAAYPWLRNHVLMNIDVSGRPHVQKWIATVSERPAAKRMLAKIATITSARDTATDDNKDRFFGRGKYARA